MRLDGLWARTVEVVPQEPKPAAAAAGHAGTKGRTPKSQASRKIAKGSAPRLLKQ